MKMNEEIEFLLQFDGMVQVEGQYIWRIRAKSAGKPLGVDYALILHKEEVEVLKYDNAHIHGHLELETHIHRGNEVVDHSFTSLYELVSDFFNEKDKLIKEE